VKEGTGHVNARTGQSRSEEGAWKDKKGKEMLHTLWKEREKGLTTNSRSDRHSRRSFSIPTSTSFAALVSLESLTDEVDAKLQLGSSEKEDERMITYVSPSTQSIQSPIFCSSEDHEIDLLPWKKIYEERYRIERNWARASCSIQNLEGHDEAVYCIQYEENLLATGSRDNTIKLWESLNGKYICTRTLVGHGGSVLCLQFDDKIIVSGSSDGLILIWDMKQGKRIHSLVGHHESVLNLHFDSKLLLTCSKDNTIKVWDRETWTLRHTLTEHTAAVNAVNLQNNLIISASGDRTLKVWNAITGQCIREMIGHERGIACLSVWGRWAASGSSDKSVRIWDIMTGACIAVIEGHTDLVRSVELREGRVISGSYDETVRVSQYNQQDGEWHFLCSLTQPGSGKIFKVQSSTCRLFSCCQSRVKHDSLCVTSMYN